MEALIEAENAYKEACELFIHTAEYEREKREQFMAARKVTKNARKHVVNCLCDLMEYKKWRDKKERIGE